jgi:hypothetical protein
MDSERLILILIGAVLAVAVSLAVFLTLQRERQVPVGEAETRILIYATSVRSDGEDWYTGPAQLESVVDSLVRAGYTVDVRDRLTLPALTSDTLTRYSEVWLLEGDADDIVETTESEADAVWAFFVRGGGVWISFENELDAYPGNWVEDAVPFLERFGLAYVGTAYSNESPQRVVADHPLFSGVDWICFDKEVGVCSMTGQSLQLVWQYPSTNPQGSARAGVWVVDERKQGRGRAVMDSGYVLGYAYHEDARYSARQDDNLSFAKNVAAWLAPVGR